MDQRKFVHSEYSARRTLKQLYFLKFWNMQIISANVDIFHALSFQWFQKPKNPDTHFIIGSYIGPISHSIQILFQFTSLDPEQYIVTQNIMTLAFFQNQSGLGSVIRFPRLGDFWCPGYWGNSCPSLYCMVVRLLHGKMFGPIEIQQTKSC